MVIRIIICILVMAARPIALHSQDFTVEPVRSGPGYAYYVNGKMLKENHLRQILSLDQDANQVYQVSRAYSLSSHLVFALAAAGALTTYGKIVSERVIAVDLVIGVLIATGIGTGLGKKAIKYRYDAVCIFNENVESRRDVGLSYRIGPTAHGIGLVLTF